ncbi:MAG: Asp-tRNA(Asn)/Glu-tRNA(Gln) amidotransferase GatCAB subunit A, partial [Giesbergeria sp.]
MSLSTHSLHEMPLSALAEALRARQVSSLEATEHFLARMRQHQHLGAFLSIDEEASRAQARATDA